MELTVKTRSMARAKTILDAAAKPLPEVVYAIQVVTTKKGKPRKRKAWAYCFWDRDRNRTWGTVSPLTFGVCWLCVKTTWTKSTSKKRLRQLVAEAESALSCRCKVVEIVLTEKDCR